MIVVRRYRPNRLPETKMPARKTTSAIPIPMLTWVGSKPPIRSWSANAGSGFSRTSWKNAWVVHAPTMALSAIHVGASSQMLRVAKRRR